MEIYDIEWLPMMNNEDRAMNNQRRKMGMMDERYNNRKITENDRRFRRRNSRNNKQIMTMNDRSKKALLIYKVRFAVTDR